MNANQKLKDEAALYALDLLDPKERASFEKAMRSDPALVKECGEMEDAIAAVALTSPPQAPPDQLGTILTRLHAAPRGRWQRTAGNIVRFGGWPVAACLTIAMVWLLATSRQSRVASTQQRNDSGHSWSVLPDPNQGDFSINNQARDLTLTEREALERVITMLQPGSNGPRAIPIETLRELRGELDRYARARQTPFEPIPGLARWVVTEMRDPSDEDSVSSRRVFDAQDIATVMAAAIDQAETGGGGQPLLVEGGDGSWNGQLKVLNGVLDIGELALPDDAVVIQEQFPEDSYEDAGLHKLKDGLFYHEASHYLYQRSADGQSYIGVKPSPDFQPEDPQSFPQPPEGPTPEAEAESVTGPRATTYFNEITGNGSIYVRDLPPAEEGVTYHLWLEDAQSSRLIDVGALPLADGETRQLIDFPHGLVGTTPSGYLITRETHQEPTAPNKEETVLAWP